MKWRIKYFQATFKNYRDWMYREKLSWTRTKNSYEIYTGWMDTMEIVINKLSKFRNMVWQLCIKICIHYDKNKSSRHITICTDLLQENFDTRFGCTFLLTSNTLVCIMLKNSIDYHNIPWTIFPPWLRHRFHPTIWREEAPIREGRWIALNMRRAKSSSL